MAIDDSELWAGMAPDEDLDPEIWEQSGEDGDNLNDEWLDIGLDEDAGEDEDWLFEFDPDADFVICWDWARPVFDKSGDDGQVGTDDMEAYLCWEPGFTDGDPGEPAYEDDSEVTEEPEGLAAICVCFPIDAIA